MSYDFKVMLDFILKYPTWLEVPHFDMPDEDKNAERMLEAYLEETQC